MGVTRKIDLKHHLVRGVGDPDTQEVHRGPAGIDGATRRQVSDGILHMMGKGRLNV